MRTDFPVANLPRFSVERSAESTPVPAARMSSVSFGYFSILALLCALVPHAFAQAPGTGAIAGEIGDTTGAVIANARITAVSEENDLQLPPTTTAEGSFRVPHV